MDVRRLLQRLKSHQGLKVVAMMVVFAGLGTAYVHFSSAAVSSQPGVAELNLMPVSATVKQGEVVNIAVNVKTNGDPLKEVNAQVNYPADTMELQSIQYACPSQDFTGGDNNSTRGTVTVHCSNSGGANGDFTMATLVFKALSDSSDAPITVSDASTITNQADGSRQQLRERKSATMQLRSRFLSPNKTPRQVPNYTSRSACPEPKPGHRRCNAEVAVDPTTGQEVRTPHSASPPGSALTPDDFHIAYQMPCTPGGPVAGKCATPSSYGPVVAITDAGAYSGGVSGLESDLQTYNQQYGIAACTIASGCLTVMNGTGGSTMPPDRGWSDEIIMDVEAVHMMCQTCKVVLVLSNDSDNTLDQAHDYAARTLNAIAVSDSWSGGSGAKSSLFTHPGVAQIVADGDDGSLGINEINEPNDFPGVVSASGTTLKVNTDGTRASETLWSGTGSACSASTAAPAWQTSLANWASAGCGSKRAYGDIAADADVNTGMPVFSKTQGSWTLGGGTSLAAPLLAGMFALANKLPTTIETSQMLYQNYATNPSSFFDVTVGSNCSSKGKTLCNAGAGFDVPTGLGVPKLAALTAGGVVTTPPPTTPPPTTPPPTTPPPSSSPKVGDINNDSKVNLTDLSMLLSKWGSADTATDLNKNGKVDISDLSMLLSHWNT